MYCAFGTRVRENSKVMFSAGRHAKPSSSGSLNPSATTKKAHEQFVTELGEMLTEAGVDLKASELVELRIDTKRLEELSKAAKDAIATVDETLPFPHPESLHPLLAPGRANAPKRAHG